MYQIHYGYIRAAKEREKEGQSPLGYFEFHRIRHLYSWASLLKIIRLSEVGAVKYRMKNTNKKLNAEAFSNKTLTERKN